MLSESTKCEIVRGLFECGVVKVSAEKPFILASGRESSIYLDHRRIYSFPKLRRQVTRAWAIGLMAELERQNVRKVGIAGTATAGIAPAYALADFLESNFVYVRGAAKTHGTSQLVEGDFDLALPYVVVDDMVTTGGSLIDAADKLREAGAKVVLASSITSHALPQANAKFAERNLTFYSLFESGEVFDLALELSLISPSAHAAARSTLNSLK